MEPRKRKASPSPTTIERATRQSKLKSSAWHSGYDVFLNFRGTDTRQTFTDLLYNTLARAGFPMFLDNEEIRKGEVIGGELLSAITSSKIYIIIFSKNYASSSWCLRELQKIVECWRNSSKSEMKKVILPIFCDVDVSEDLKLRSDFYLTSLQEHKDWLGDAAVKPWEDALKEVATISGWNLKDHSLTELVNLVRLKVFSIIEPFTLADRLAGRHDIVMTKANVPLLDQGSYSFRNIVMHFVSAIEKNTLNNFGKTAHAFEEITSHFQDEARTSGAQATVSGRPPEHDDGVYEVFLNFRGPDTRLTFVDILYNALRRAGIRVFYDDEAIREGEEIEGELKSAISNCKIYIIIFSKDYASSKWCLREIDLMMEHERKSKGGAKKVILPIFYEVDADDVKLKTNLYHKAMEKHEKEFGKDVAEQWKKALRQVAKIKGYNLKSHGMDKLKDLVVEAVRRKVPRSQMKVPDNLVGIYDSVENIMKSVGQDTSDVRFVVIHGMGGIGKTTLAKHIFNQISSYFQGQYIFLPDIRESWLTTSGILNLQEKILCKILDLRSFPIHDADDGANTIKQRLKDEKVLIVLDNMNNIDQLNKLAGAPSWFGEGSRIIITTRDVDYFNLVDKGERKCEDFYFHEMKELQLNDAMELFRKLAFKNEVPPSDYDDISREIVVKTGGLPLAIEVIGHLLSNKEKNEWEYILGELKEVVHKDVREKLMISINDLDHKKKEIFLDIACLFINIERTDAIYYWEAQKLVPKRGIDALINMSLIKIVDADKLWMHDILRDLGRNIIDSEKRVPGRRSRLWSPEVAFDVVCKKKGTERLVGLKLGTLDASCSFTYEQFARLRNLNFLDLDGGNFANGEFDGVFSELRWLSWNNCPKFQANKLCFENLIVLKLSESLITDDWSGWDEIKMARKLKVLSCTYCRCLMKTPDFSTFPELKRLVFKNCLSLKEIDPSIGMLEHLNYLEITNPIFYTVRLPEEAFSWKLKMGQPQILPNSIGGLKSLSVLKLKFVNLSVLPASIGELVNLEQLCLWCPELEELPDSVGNLNSLFELDISFTAITQVPEFVVNLGSLKVFRYENSRIRMVPDSIRKLVPPREWDMYRSGIEPAKIVQLLTNM